MICPFDDKICLDPECKEGGCWQEKEDEGEESIKKDMDVNA